MHHQRHVDLTLCVFGSLAVAGCFAVGCGPARPGTSPETLVGAKFEIPVYPGARVVSRKSVLFHKEEMKGSNQNKKINSPEVGGNETVSSFDALTWQLTTADPTENIVTYYKARLPDAQRGTPEVTEPFLAGEEGETTTEFRYTPSNGKEGEAIVISIGESGLEITQITRRD